MPKGIFELTETTYVDVIWFCAWEDTDWMAILSKPTADGKWTLVYRFRYYTPDESVDKVWESNDRKSVYRLQTDATEAKRAKLEATTDALVEQMASIHAPQSRASKLLVRGNAQRAIELLNVQDWAHMKIIPASEVEAP